MHSVQRPQKLNSSYLFQPCVNSAYSPPPSSVYVRAGVCQAVYARLYSVKQFRRVHTEPCASRLVAARFNTPICPMFNNRCVTLMGSMLLAGMMMICGCGGSEQQYASSEEAAVKEAVSNFSEAGRTAEGLAVLFVEGATPDAATRKRFAPYMPSASSVSVSGNIATVDVELEELATGNIIGPAEWTLEKVGDQWKIKTCPFP